MRRSIGPGSQSTAVTPLSDMRVCPQCGALCGGDSSEFCRGDGMPLVDVSQSSEQWKEGMRHRESARKLQQKRARRVKIRWLVTSMVAMLVLTRIVYVVAVKGVEHTPAATPTPTATV